MRVTSREPGEGFLAHWAARRGGIGFGLRVALGRGPQQGLSLASGRRFGMAEVLIVRPPEPVNGMFQRTRRTGGEHSQEFRWCRAFGKKSFSFPSLPCPHSLVRVRVSNAGGQKGSPPTRRSENGRQGNASQNTSVLVRGIRQSNGDKGMRPINLKTAVEPRMKPGLNTDSVGQQQGSRPAFASLLE